MAVPFDYGSITRELDSPLIDEDIPSTASGAGSTVSSLGSESGKDSNSGQQANQQAGQSAGQSAGPPDSYKTHTAATIQTLLRNKELLDSYTSAMSKSNSYFVNLGNMLKNNMGIMTQHILLLEQLHRANITARDQLVDNCAAVAQEKAVLEDQIDLMSKNNELLEEFLHLKQENKNLTMLVTARDKENQILLASVTRLEERNTTLSHKKDTQYAELRDLQDDFDVLQARADEMEAERTEQKLEDSLKLALDILQAVRDKHPNHDPANSDSSAVDMDDVEATMSSIAITGSSDNVNTPTANFVDGQDEV